MLDEPNGDLLKRFVRGDEAAFESLFRRFEREVYGWIFRIVRDPGTAEDALVEAFWRAYRGRARFDPTRSFGAWMRRIATNVARDHLRAARARPAWSLSDRIAAPDRPDPHTAETIALAFRRLPIDQQVAATLALVEERPYAEIADALDVPLGTVKSRVFRAVRALRRELARLDVQP